MLRHAGACKSWAHATDSTVSSLQDVEFNVLEPTLSESSDEWFLGTATAYMLKLHLGVVLLNVQLCTLLQRVLLLQPVLLACATTAAACACPLIPVLQPFSSGVECWIGFTWRHATACSCQH